MKAKLEPIEVRLGPLWIVVDEKTTRIPPVKGKDGRVYGATTERRQFCNIAIIDYGRPEDARRIGEAIINALEAL